MKIYMQLLFILLFSFIGEAASNLLHLPVPGPILGMILLFLALEFKLIEFRHVDNVGAFLLNNMTILFLPAGVGIMAKWHLISGAWLKILAILVIMIVINFFITGRLVQFIKVKFEGDYKGPFSDNATNKENEKEEKNV